MDPFAAFVSAVLNSGVLLNNTQLNPPATPASPALVAMGDAPGGGGLGAAPPRLSVAIRSVGNQLVCGQRARMAMMSTGATGVGNSDDAIWGVYGGSTSAMIWCRPNGEAVILAGGPGGLPSQVLDALKSNF